MYYRNFDGDLIEITKYDYLTDTQYYEKILKLQLSFAKLNKNNNIVLKEKQTNNYIINNMINKELYLLNK
jgi:hypothetical protein